MRGSMINQELVDNMERVWSFIVGLCFGLTDGQWETLTDCPGWSVQDQISHLVGSESGILGRPDPDHKPPDYPYLKNDLGQRNEIVVDWRRSWPGERVFQEFREVTAERMKQLRSMCDQDFARERETPIGPGTEAEYLRIRIFDAWVHEQDMRRALGQQGNLDGPVAIHSVEREAMAMPYVVGRKVRPPDGTTVIFQVTGAAGRTIPVGTEDGRGTELAAVPALPTARVIMDMETFSCLCCGRWDPARTLASGRVELEGDRALGETIVHKLSFMI